MENKIMCPGIMSAYDVVLLYKDIVKVVQIDRYYHSKMKEVRNSNRLNEYEKAGQREFLHSLWQEELEPYLELWSVRLYNSV